MESYDDDTGFAGDTFGAPAEVARVETEGTVFGVSATDTDEMDALAANTSVGWLTALLECSVEILLAMWWELLSYGPYLFFR